MGALFGIGLRFRGPFDSWETALKASSGYDGAAILDRVRAAMLQVQRGTAAYERDSVVFAEPHQPFPVTAALLRAALSSGGRLSVLDFGGGLGGLLAQCRPFLFGLTSLRWFVVEQPHFAACGAREFQDSVLHFYSDLRLCLAEADPNIAVLSGVLQYVPDPDAVLDQIRAKRVPYIFVNRTPVARGDRQILVQVVPRRIYPASYPSWVFEDQFIERHCVDYAILAAFDSSGDPRVRRRGTTISFRGWLLKHKTAVPG